MRCLGYILIFILGNSLVAGAAIPSQKVLSGQGVSFGGLAGSGFTLLDVRVTADKKKKMERVVIDVGDMQGATLRGWPGYYHAELKKNPQRLVIDFAQMPNSRVTQERLAQILTSSRAVKNTVMSLDPLDSSLNLTMDLHPNTKVKVYQVAGKKTTSKVVLDFITE
ncbi:MAG: hypothetical protein AAGB31_15400 [Bdellovibrio sp.]